MPFYCDLHPFSPVNLGDLTPDGFLALLDPKKVLPTLPGVALQVINTRRSAYGPVTFTPTLRFHFGEKVGDDNVYIYLCLLDDQFDLRRKVGEGQLPQDLNSVTQDMIAGLIPGAAQADLDPVARAIAACQSGLRDITPQERVAQVWPSRPDTAAYDPEQVADLRRLLTALGPVPLTGPAEAAIETLLAAAADPKGWLETYDPVVDWPDSHIKYFNWTSLLLSHFRDTAPLAMIEGRSDHIQVANALTSVIGDKLSLPSRTAEVEDLESAYDQSRLHLADAQTQVAKRGITLVRIHDFGDADLIGRIPTDQSEALQTIGATLRCPLIPV